MSKRIDQLPVVTPTTGDKYVIFDASTGDVASVDLILPMVGATATEAGAGGTVPAASIGSNLHSLRGDGTYKINDVKITTYTTSGANTFTPDTRTLYAIVEVQAGGAGGGGAPANTLNTNGRCSGGGGGGGYAKIHLTKAQLGTAAITATVGAGGGSSGNGNPSSFGSFITSNAGATTGSSAETTNTAIWAGGSGGSVSAVSGATLLFSHTGQTGGGGYNSPASNLYNGNGGCGGDSFLGKGAPSEAAVWGASCSSIPRGATGYGAGGAGVAHTTTSARSGSSGTGGIIIIYEYM